ncbi:MAG: symporter small accessory protein [Candidatus Firestonebacteria bacterium]
MKFGFGDWGVWAAYAISIASVAICIIYGIVKWNKNAK